MATVGSAVDVGGKSVAVGKGVAVGGIAVSVAVGFVVGGTLVTVGVKVAVGGSEVGSDGGLINAGGAAEIALGLVSRVGSNAGFGAALLEDKAMESKGFEMDSVNEASKPETMPFAGARYSASLPTAYPK